SSVDLVARRLAVQYPAADGGVDIRVIPEKFARPAPAVASFVPVIASLFLVLPGLLLLLACLNVANLLLARASARQREMAIRAAVGGARGRLIRQMLTESLLLALLGGAAGVAFGEGAIRLGAWMLRPVLTNSSGYSLGVDAGFDWRVFGYALAVTIFTGVFVGVWPAFRAGRANVNVLLHAGGRGDSGGVGGYTLRKALVVMQIAGSLVLLIVSGLFVRSLGRAEHLYLGFDPDRVLAMMLDPQQIGYGRTRATAFYRELADRVRAMPGVQSASLSFTVPMTYGSKSGAIYFEGRPLPPNRQPPAISFNCIGPAYFQTMRIPLVGGRGFRDSDNETARPVAIVNRTMAGKFWPDEDPIGKRFSVKNAGGPFIEVVGIAGDG
ncbi:MAG: FtsX-like permease family protein, partial [Bryobacteraceae bacterium]